MSSSGERGYKMRTLHGLGRLLEGEWFLAEDESTILKLD